MKTQLIFFIEFKIFAVMKHPHFLPKKKMRKQGTAHAWEKWMRHSTFDRAGAKKIRNILLAMTTVQYRPKFLRAAEIQPTTS